VAVCHFHRDRPGVGVCMRCRKVICAACCTRLAGVNHCHACLKIIGARRDEKAARRGSAWVLTAAVVLAGGCLALFGLGWLLQGTMAP
jgi:hypothetical protein